MNAAADTDADTDADTAWAPVRGTKRPARAARHARHPANATHLANASHLANTTDLANAINIATTTNVANDSGVFILSSLTKVALVVLIVGVVGHDAISIVTTHIAATDQAVAAAEIGRDTLRDTGSPEAAYERAFGYARAHGDDLPSTSFTAGANNTVALTLTRIAPTLIAQYLSPLDSYRHANGHAVASDPVG